MLTSPEPASFFFKNEFILFSRYVPSFVVGNPEGQINEINEYQEKQFTFSRKCSQNNQYI